MYPKRVPSPESRWPLSAFQRPWPRRPVVSASSRRATAAQLDSADIHLARAKPKRSPRLASLMAPQRVNTSTQVRQLQPDP
jgi:hypothetical protein